MPRQLLLPLLPLLAACPSDPAIVDDTAADESSSSSDPTTGEPAPAIPAGDCDYGATTPTRLAVITNNFTDPAALHVLDLATGELTADVAPATSDPALAWGDGKLALIGRFGFNNLEILDGAEWTSLATLPVAVDGVAEPNPQALTFAADGRAYLTLFASPAVQIFDFARPAAENPIGALDLADFADADGSPEAGVALACGDVLFVGVQRLVDFAPVDQSFLVPLDLAAGAPIDLDSATDGPQAIALQGPWPKQFRRDPADPSGHTALVLTSSLERVDLTTGAVTWAVDPARLTALGIDGFDPQSFAVSADGAAAYLVATDGDFPASAVFRLGLTDADDARLVEGLATYEKVLEIAGDTLWVADADPAMPRLRSFDLTQSPPAEADPIALPGQPYLVLALP